MEIITSHDNADFDALASMLAASKLYPQAKPILPRRLNRNLRDFLTLYGEELPFTRQEELPRRRINRVILVDTQTLPPLKGLDPGAEICIIDHHSLDRDLEKGIAYRGGNVGSTTTILVQEITEKRIPLSPVEATLLLLGIHEDTGSLTYPSTSPTDVHSAAWLLEQGANLEVVMDFLHQPLSEAQRRLYDHLLQGAEFHELKGQKVMVACADADVYVEEISTLAHKLRDLYDPDALFLLVRMDDRIQLVARSTTEAIDVAQIARYFNGGGHNKAAAALIESRDIKETKDKLLGLLRDHIKPSVTVGEIMSLGVHTLGPQTTVAEAEKMMRRYGHEGFPVVDKGRLVGIMTRREIDRAHHHGLHKASIANYMHKGEINVSPADSVERLQQIMMEEGIGQVPVVQDGKIVGIVTRTDLIKLWSRPPHPSRAQEIARRMEGAFPAPLLDLLKRAGQVAKEMGYSLYLVGGVVRDLLLGTPNLDIDLVVEGEAIALARHLAREGGGRVYSHARFGTAKIIFEGTSPITPLNSLDFVTARTEFYEHPTALPSVERSSIKQDLHRRDFTINTLAISLDKEHWGELLDFYGGEEDLKKGLIRVLHNLSFIEDPTRILRAVRLEQRLGFRLEERTQELIAGALDLFPRVSGERVRQELWDVFQEESPSRTMARLQELEVLAHIHPALCYRETLQPWVDNLPSELKQWQAMGCRRREQRAQPSLALYLALLSNSAEASKIEDLLSRMRLSLAEGRRLRQITQLRELAPRLKEGACRRSALYHLLAPFSSEVLFLFWLTTHSRTIKRRLELYHRSLACVEPTLDGHALRLMGIPPGPIYTEILEALREARLDGKLKTVEGEKRLVKRILAARDSKGS